MGMHTALIHLRYHSEVNVKPYNIELCLPALIHVDEKHAPVTFTSMFTINPLDQALDLVYACEGQNNYIYAYIIISCVSSQP